MRRSQILVRAAWVACLFLYCKAKAPSCQPISAAGLVLVGLV